MEGTTQLKAVIVEDFYKGGHKYLKGEILNLDITPDKRHTLWDESRRVSDVPTLYFMVVADKVKTRQESFKSNRRHV